MASEDKMLSMHIRRILARKTADMTEMEITCVRGVVQLSGKLKEPRGFRGRLDLKDELESIMDMIRRFPEVRDVTSTVQIEGQSFRVKK
ncbi:MAG: hypothetical protein AUJ92_17705 [Armatimonadetes bacterium CG2_30_59_28]|nr:hypothetical protein [Armatimonadota bacterium]OIO90868.1 MAG: hypothetical protein AUJ92_17705 [Armatimonadetes bacterium CG2_30_59_28]PIU63968.1 MAG: hypothetical protein COS85_14380 [Armatimonadetes bacterium CG07_land_8_20_14_0_80_59_28]PIX43920.1 MAG: hypothetical protein COZ56_05985 [Armatimonadetes bacterium CG_4_8_14_3_um_filter_58_9]PIY43602.1 MAG: hypothetical protein COZ05_10595 [Armatimonadetes bacterium CG_4_10_14_3_um_filter_59_10]PJB64059.1 MAG: hypothetical protein CO095_152